MSQDWDYKVPKVSDPITDPPAPCYELVVSDHVQPISPSDYGVELDKFDPSEYFVTSGDAVEKVRYMLKVVAKLIDNVAKGNYNRNNKKKRTAELTKELNKTQTEVQKLLDRLITIRGTAIFLESEWNRHVLVVIPKNPRSKKTCLKEPT